MKDPESGADPDQRKMEYIASSLVLRAIAIKHRKNVKGSTRRTSSTTQIPLRNPELRYFCIGVVKLLMEY
jgi:hypothetical protein